MSVSDRILGIPAACFSFSSYVRHLVITCFTTGTGGWGSRLFIRCWWVNLWPILNLSMGVYVFPGGRGNLYTLILIWFDSDVPWIHCCCHILLEIKMIVALASCKVKSVRSRPFEDKIVSRAFFVCSFVAQDLIKVWYP